MSVIRLSSFIDPMSHAAQSIHGAAGDLLDQARQVERFEDAMRLTALARALRDRLDAVAELASARADAISEAQ